MSNRLDWKRLLPWALIALLVCTLLHLLSDILMPFVVSAALAYLSDPLVGKLQKRGLPRTWGSLLAVILITSIVVLLFLLVVPLVWREAQLLSAKLPAVIDAIQDRVLPWISAKLGVSLQLDSETLRSWVREHWSKASSVLSLVFSKAGTSGGAALGVAVNLMLIPVVTFYFLLDWPRIIDGIASLIPRPVHQRAMQLLAEIDDLLAAFVRGQLLVMATLAVYYSLGLWIAGVSFPLPVGILTGLLIFIPFVGYGLGLVLAIVVALLQFEGWPPLIGVAVVYTIGQVIESFFLTPRIVGERIGLHPLVVIFMLMAFGQLFGFTGVLVALPVCAVGAVAYRELRQHYLASDMYRGPSRRAPR